jgi:excisionase family DNA binding protein
VRAQTVLKNMIDRGDLPAVRVGTRRVRVRRADLDAFLVAKKAADQPADLRTDLAAAAASVQRRAAGSNDAELAVALRSLARAANRMAGAIERQASRPLAADSDPE